MAVKGIHDVNGMSEQEAGRWLKEVAGEHTAMLQGLKHTRNDLADFFDEIGLGWLGDAIRQVTGLYRQVKALFDLWFS